MVPYEVTIYTGDETGAGTDSNVFIKVFGAGGSTSDIFIEKVSERFERGRTDFIKVYTSNSFNYLNDLVNWNIIYKIMDFKHKI